MCECLKIIRIGQSAAKFRIGEGSTTIAEMRVEDKRSRSGEHPTGWRYSLDLYESISSHMTGRV